MERDPRGLSKGRAAGRLSARPPGAKILRDRRLSACGRSKNVTKLLHRREQFARRTSYVNFFSLQRRQARNAAGAREIERCEACQPLQRLQARDTTGAAEIERCEACRRRRRDRAI